MDRKTIIILALCLALFFSWGRLTERWFPQPKAPPVDTNQVANAANGTNALTAGSNQPAAASVASASASAGGPAPFIVHEEVPEQVMEVANDEAHYTFTSRGGGLKGVELIRYPETVSSIRRKVAQTNNFAALNTPAAPPVLAILGVGQESLQGDGVFTLSRITGGVRAEKALANGLSVVKEFRVEPNYVVGVTVRLENTSAAPLKLPEQEWVAGTATPMSPQDLGTAVSVLGYNGEATFTVNQSWFNPRTMIFFPGEPRSEYRITGTNVVWVAAQNQFFSLVTMPKTPAPGLVVRMLNLPAPSQEELRSGSRAVAAPKGYLTALDYPAVTLAPHQAVEQSFNVFAGPKENHTLAGLGAKFSNHLELVMGFNGWFGFVSKGLLGTMNWLHRTALVPYGWAIIAITVVLKVIFWPLTQYSTRSMKRMQALQPQMKAMQEKYKDDPQKLTQKQMEFWKKNKVNPLSGCLPMLLQIPVFIGFYRMLQSAIELRGAHFLWIGDLSKPDTIFVLPGFNFPINPMPLIMGCTMLWQASLQPPSPGMDPAQQKIMKFMPLIMLFFLYNFSSGLALYWTVQNLLTVLQTKLTKAQAGPPAPTPMAPQKKKN